LLPNGFDASGAFVQLSLVASPRLADGLTQVPAGSALTRWPTVVNELIAGRLTVVHPLSKQVTPVTVISAPPDQALWERLIPLGKPALPYGGTAGTPILVPAETSFSHAAALQVVESMYAQAAQATASPAAHPIHRALLGLQAWMAPPVGGEVSSAVAAAAAATRSPAVAELMSPARLTAAHIEQAATILRAQGQDAAADVAPLVPILRRLRIANRGNAKPRAAVASPAAALPPVEDTDLHQVLGMLLDHLALALRLGLRIDLHMPAFSDDAVLRIGDAQGRPLNGPVPLPQPWSAVNSDPVRRRFVMSTQPGAPGVEIVRGMVDLRPEIGRCVVTDIDPVGIAEQLASVAASAAISGNVIAEALPPRRDTGLIVAQIDRRSTAFDHMVKRNARFDGGAGPDELEGAPVLYADDVTTGYRVDVAQGDGPYRSLMRRKVRYTVVGGSSKAPIELDTTDEGSVEPFNPVEQADDAGQAHLFVGEELFGWYDWSLAAPRPGPSVGGQIPGDEQVSVPDRKPFPGVPLLVDVSAEPGTLPRLRYGASYRFRARAVDIAGNSIDPALADPTIATAPFKFRRREAVAPPILVPRAAFEAGESLNRLVVLHRLCS
jgi:hypothetical protein